MFSRTRSGLRATSMPATSARPAVGRKSPQSIRINVDLPAPLGPRKPMISPRRTEKLTSSTAVNAPKRLTRRSVTILTSPFGASGLMMRPPD